MTVGKAPLKSGRRKTALIPATASYTCLSVVPDQKLCVVSARIMRINS
jgi:hypothetical protein